MKPSFPRFASLKFRFQPRARRGMALLIVLGSLVFISALVVAFLSSTQTELKSSKMYAQGSTVKLLSNTAVNIVQAQIRTATTQSNKTSWASQPGAIRTFDDSGKLAKVYKLYSSSNMTVSTFNPKTEVEAYSAWDKNTARFTDLNEPVNDNYPILNPNVLNSNGSSKVEGFALNNAPVATTKENPNQAPMPAEWLYVLKSGKIVAATDGSDENSVTISEASATDPIVARVAFWTDDETSKVNINTASEGVYWDWPTNARSSPEIDFGVNQPGQNEFNRYPGHPATTSLSPILGSYMGLSAGQKIRPTLYGPVASNSVTPPSVSLDSSVNTYLEKIYKLTPRVIWGGSQAGTKSVTTGNSIKKVNLDKDRLYATVDEYIFAQPSAGATDRTAQQGLDHDTLEQVKFFLTAQSRAPETTLFNTPKISLWPQHTDPAKRDSSDNLLRFCSTINDQAYYFQRTDPNSPTVDWGIARNQQLHAYLQRLLESKLPDPAGAASFQTKYGAPATKQLTTTLMDYIRSCINIMSTAGESDPYQYSYTNKPKATKALDVGSGQVVPLDTGTTKGYGRFPVLSAVSLHFVARYANQPPQFGVPPTATLNTMHPYFPDGGVALNLNVNRYPSFRDTGGLVPVALGFVTVGAGEKFYTHPLLRYATVRNGSATGPFNIPNEYFPGTYNVGDTAGAVMPDLAEGQTLVEGVFSMTFVNPAPGYPPASPSFRVRVEGLDTLRDGGTSMNFPSDESMQFQEFADNNGKPQGSRVTISHFAKTLTRNWSTSGNPFYTSPLFTVNGKSINLNSGDITIKVYAPGSGEPSGTTDLVQTYTVKFPTNANVPTPLLPTAVCDAESDWAAPKPSGTYFFDRASIIAGVGFKPVAVTGAGASGGFNLFARGYLTSRLYMPFIGTKHNYQSWGYRSIYGMYWSNSGTRVLFPAGVYRQPAQVNAETNRSFFDTCDTIRTLEVAYGDPRQIAVMRNVPASFFVPGAKYNDATFRADHSWRFGSPGYYLRGASMGLNPMLTDTFTINSSAQDYYHRFNATTSPTSGTLSGTILPLTDVSAENNNSAAFWGYYAPDVNTQVNFNNAVFKSKYITGADYDMGIPYVSPGPYIGKADEGSANTVQPYWGSTSSVLVGTHLSSPNRQVPSAVIFGSLPPTASQSVIPTDPLFKPWQTLLFCPNPNSGSFNNTTHDSLTRTPKDYYLLDFFTMPIVEPYAISEPLSTAGKINMNYQILPYTYIQRDTGLRAVLKSAMLIAIPDRAINYFESKENVYNASSDAYNSNDYWRFPVHAGETLKQFETRFTDGDIFRTPAEICDLFLYPGKQNTPSTALVTDTLGSTANIKSWWYDGKDGERKSITPDNMRERPYRDIYPRLTTKSNTFTVHYRVQTLTKPVNDNDPQTWKDSPGLTSSEYRGSTTIERYVDPNDTNIPDYATNAGAPSIDKFYKFRVVASKQFNP